MTTPDSNLPEKSDVPPNSGSPAPYPEGITPLRSGLDKLANRPGGVTEMLAMVGSVGGNPLHQKMTTEHVTQVLDLSAKHDEREFLLTSEQQKIDGEARNSERKYHFAYFVGFLALLIFVCLMFRAQPTVLAPILSGIGGAATGFVGGMGYAKTKKD